MSASSSAPAPLGAPPAIIRAEDLTRTFGSGTAAVRALRGVSFAVPPGEMTALWGRSGSGKTTLLNILAGLDRPTSGRAWVAGREVTAMSRDEQLRLRREQVSIVFQSFALLPMLTVAENVGLPMRLSRADPASRERRVEKLLVMVGLAGSGRKRPYELSGGEQQRVGIARALASDAPLLLADEPTGQLDSQTGRQIMSLISGIVRERGLTAIVATHDRAIVDLADCVLTITNGRVDPAQDP